MPYKTIIVLISVAAISWTLAGESQPPSFTRKPSVSGSGPGARIEFAVNRETDVSIFIEDAKGAVVRHLVSGVLGANAPAPLKSGSLSQAVEWDGKADYGRTAPPRAYKVRVALGLGAKYDKVLAEDPQNIGGVRGLTVGADGTLYVCAAFGADVANWSGERIIALGRDGKYLRTVKPFASSVKKEDAATIGIAESDGQIFPLYKNVIGRSFYAAQSPRKGGMAITADNVILRPMGGYNAGPLAISALNIHGTAPWGTELGTTKLFDMARPSLGRSFICVSSDGKSAYMTGFGEVRPGQKPEHARFSSVFRVPLPERGPATPFFGARETSAKDEAHLSDEPRGLALDGKGNLLIADHKNDRIVVVSEASAQFVGQFPVVKPDSVAVDPATGNVYVTRVVDSTGGVEVVKLSGWKDAKELAKTLIHGEGDPNFLSVMALDAGTKPPIVWIGCDYGSLWRVEDQGAKLSAAKINTGGFGTAAFIDINVDRFSPGREIYCRTGSGIFTRYIEETGKFEQISTGTAINEGVCIQPGPDGNLYGLGYPANFLRFAHDGKPNPWPAGNIGYPEKTKGPANGIFVPVSMVFMTHTLGFRHDGHVFVFEPGHPGDRPPKMLREYTLDGKRVSDTPIIWKVSDACIGPKFDPQGNIYVAEQIKPLDQPYPKEFASVVGPVEPEKTYLADQPAKDALCTMYGSIVKFSPKGGMIKFNGENPYKGEAVLDPALKTVDAGCYTQFRFHPTKVVGAEWIKPCVSHVDLHYCNCENIRFDVDEFGRVWYPDTCRFRVGVLDTNGNDITHFGAYGNADSRGPESKDKALAQPEIAFSWLVGVGATDKYAYMGDSMNRRLLRAKLTYAAEESCDIK